MISENPALNHLHTWMGRRWVRRWVRLRIILAVLLRVPRWRWWTAWPEDGRTYPRFMVVWTWIVLAWTTGYGILGPLLGWLFNRPEPLLPIPWWAAVGGGILLDQVLQGVHMWRTWRRTGSTRPDTALLFIPAGWGKTW